ncbi:YggS family pyridoxal phosphate-dependent enzyme [Geodermatophilus sp. YIM 151500]|uniref:YggS family pyridoxal phosphate-dependent enzyme n=1 Tax=Geodermatophilus sp. YIM 151500 TaxID=2984531 RepID=UPI0021E3B26C|nr:YggS family pyridoxal phosphate-dependent enzyme [Geodermatophilus sp. YIM 151500]MCV2491734.1 YggS family pyridoxal phosphate-dependent enzyme [Geodermatophilus sp. YIM 151500]
MARLEENLHAVRARIDAAARRAGRDPAAVALLAVSKTWPAADVAALAALGQTDFAENRAQELTAKAAELAGLDLRWHFVGQLQRNKAAAVARLGAVVHSVDRASLVAALGRAGTGAGRPVDVFVQVDLGGPSGTLAARGGAPPADVPGLADAVAAAAGLRLRGLMAVAPRGIEPGPAFAALAELAAQVRADHPEATELSAGMSGDLEEAIAAGATVVRVGTAIFGDRPLPSGQHSEVTPAPEVPGASGATTWQAPRKARRNAGRTPLGAAAEGEV